MTQRYREFTLHQTAARKVFSANDKLSIIIRQGYMCPGHYCQGNVPVPEEHDLDHVRPLFQGGDTEELNSMENLQVLCTRCHRHKTSHERREFFRLERVAKFPCPPFVPAAKYHSTTDTPDGLSPYFREQSAP